MKSIKNTMLKAAMGFSWKLMNTGENVVAFAERLGADDVRASMVEVLIQTAGRSITFAGERLELGTNRVAMWTGYDDGELSGIVAWAAPSH